MDNEKLVEFVENINGVFMRHELKSWHIYFSGYLSIRNRYFLVKSSFFRIKALKDVIFSYVIFYHIHE